MSKDLSFQCIEPYRGHRLESFDSFIFIWWWTNFIFNSRFVFGFRLSNWKYGALLEGKHSKNKRTFGKKAIGEKLCFWNSLEMSFHELMLFMPHDTPLENSITPETSTPDSNCGVKPLQLKRALTRLRNLGSSMETIQGKIEMERKQFYQDEEWKFIALVLDRVLLWIFSSVVGFGTFAILNPHLYTIWTFTQNLIETFNFETLEAHCNFLINRKIILSFNRIFLVYRRFQSNRINFYEIEVGTGLFPVGKKYSGENWGLFSRLVLGKIIKNLFLQSRWKLYFHGF